MPLSTSRWGFELDLVLPIIKSVLAALASKAVPNISIGNQTLTGVVFMRQYNVNDCILVEMRDEQASEIAE